MDRTAIPRYVWAKSTIVAPFVTSSALLAAALTVSPWYYLPYCLFGGLVGYYAYGCVSWRLACFLPFNLLVPAALCWQRQYRFSSLRRVLRSPDCIDFVDRIRLHR